MTAQICVQIFVVSGVVPTYRNNSKDLEKHTKTTVKARKSIQKQQ